MLIKTREEQKEDIIRVSILPPGSNLRHQHHDHGSYPAFAAGQDGFPFITPPGHFPYLRMLLITGRVQTLFGRFPSAWQMRAVMILASELTVSTSRVVGGSF